MRAGRGLGKLIACPTRPGGFACVRPCESGSFNKLLGKPELLGAGAKRIHHGEGIEFLPRLKILAQ